MVLFLLFPSCTRDKIIWQITDMEGHSVIVTSVHWRRNTGRLLPEFEIGNWCWDFCSTNISRHLKIREHLCSVQINTKNVTLITANQLHLFIKKQFFKLKCNKHRKSGTEYAQTPLKLKRQREGNSFTLIICSNARADCNIIGFWLPIICWSIEL